MKHLKLFEQFLAEHHQGLKNFYDLTGSAYSDMWRRCQDAARDYLQEKGLSPETIAYWTRPDTAEDHQENIHIPFIYNEAILDEVEFTFEEGFFDAKFMYPFLSKQTSQERDRKWAEAIEKGTDYFKGVPVVGETPAARQAFLEISTRDWLSSGQKTKPICVMQPAGSREWLVVDGGHRLWCASRLFPEGIDLYMVKVTERVKS